MLFKPARKIAAVAAVALTAGAFTSVVPATAASGTLNYTCTVPIVGDKTFTVTVDTDAPASIALGQSFTPKMAATVNVDDATRNLLADVGAVSIEGTTNAAGEVSDITYTAGGAPITTPITVPVTAIDKTKPLAVAATATAPAVKPTAVGALNIVAGDFDAVLAGKDAGGAATLASPYTIPCKLVPGQNAVVDTVQVTEAPVTPAPAKVDSTTAVKAKFAKKKKAIITTVKVKGADSSAGTGKVKVTLKLGKKKVKAIRAKLSANGVAKAVFKKITKKGKYKIEAVYAGSATHNASKGKATVKVK